MLSKKKSAMILLLKYGFSIAVVMMCCIATEHPEIMVLALAELFFIWALSNAAMKRLPVVGHILHFVLLFIFDAQMLVMYFGNSYISLLMLTNLVSLQDLSGDYGTYMIFIIPMVILLLLPMPVLSFSKKLEYWTAFIAIVIWLCMVLLIGLQASPLLSIVNVAKQAFDYYRVRNGIEVNNDAEEAKAEFYHDKAAGFYNNNYHSQYPPKGYVHKGIYNGHEYVGSIDTPSSGGLVATANRILEKEPPYVVDEGYPTLHFDDE